MSMKISFFNNLTNNKLYVVWYEYKHIYKIDFEKIIKIAISTNDTYVFGDLPKQFIGPKLDFFTPWGSNAKTILNSCGIPIERIEVFRVFQGTDPIPDFDPLLEKIYIGSDFLSEVSSQPITGKDNQSISLSEINTTEMGFDDQDMLFYKQLYSRLGRDPTILELMDFSQSNSEHSRHHFFKGKIFIDGKQQLFSLFQKVKQTNTGIAACNSMLAFCDNASAIKNSKTDNVVQHLFATTAANSREYKYSHSRYFPTFTAETHNFPTLLLPFQGATTGVGGRIRDTLAIGRGGLLLAGSAGYCMKNLDVLIRASNGASDYGNKIGEPLVLGFTRIDPAWEKPIMFSGGFGQVCEENLAKYSPEAGDLIVKVGGPAYRIGIGGGAVSSRITTEHTIDTDLAAVQRGDPEMANKMMKFVTRCAKKHARNPIRAIHDQGAGGTANVTKEIIGENHGANIYLNEITRGDPTMTDIELWISEYQEQMTFLLTPEDLPSVTEIAEEENVTLDVIGQINTSGITKVFSASAEDNLNPVFDIPQKEIIDVPRKSYHLSSSQPSDPSNSPSPPKPLVTSSVWCHWKSVLSETSVGSKRFLVNKVDRHVSGLVAQQQCVGPFHTPIADYSLLLNSLFGDTGVAGSIGEKHYPIHESCRMVSMCVGEMLTNLLGVVVSDFHDIKTQANWMWPGKDIHLVRAVDKLSDLMKILEIGIDGGKDSLSMHHKGIDAPGSLVLSSYAPVNDIAIRVTPEFKSANNAIYMLDLSYGKERMGGSVLSRIKNATITELQYPEFESPETFRNIFEKIQYLISAGVIKSIHDRSDGGLFATLAEMCISSGYGCQILPTRITEEYLFNEELGAVIEVDSNRKSMFQTVMEGEFSRGSLYELGKVIRERSLIVGWKIIFLEELQQAWERPSYHADREQTNHECADQEYSKLYSRNTLPPENCMDGEYCPPPKPLPVSRQKFVGIFRTEGSNGENEMAAAFKYAGFRPLDLPLKIIMSDPSILDKLSGIAFVGGFSFMDVFGPGTGAAEIVKHNRNIFDPLLRFYKRKNTFSIGVCNGCQFMVKMNSALKIGLPNVQIKGNTSGRFESRYCYVTIPADNKRVPSPWTDRLKGKTLGVWTAFSTGRFEFQDDDPNNPIHTNTCAMKYHISNSYPENPGNSKAGIAAVVSRNGRHIAMMPHPERTFLKCQVPWHNKGTGKGRDLGPWTLLFSAFAT